MYRGGATTRLLVSGSDLFPRIPSVKSGPRLIGGQTTNQTAWQSPFGKGPQSALLEQRRAGHTKDHLVARRQTRSFGVLICLAVTRAVTSRSPAVAIGDLEPDGTESTNPGRPADSSVGC